MLYDTIIPTKYMRNVPIRLKKDTNGNFILESYYNNRHIKIIDAKEHNLNENITYPLHSLLKLNSAIVRKEEDFMHDIIFNIYNYLYFLKDHNITLSIQTIVVIANCTDLDNAFWNGYYLVFGGGRGNHLPLTCSAIVGHELTHVLIGENSILDYKGHAGALNESYADIFGVMFEFYVQNKYGIAFELGSETNQTLRDFQYPEKYNQPRYMYDGYYMNPSYTHDNGGVHTNSGIINHLFFELQEELGLQQAFKLYLDVFYKLKKNTTFYEFKELMLQSIDNTLFDKKIMLMSIICRHIY